MKSFCVGKRNHYARLSIGFLSRWATASQRVYFGGKFSHLQGVFVLWSRARWCNNQISNCARQLLDVYAEVSRVFKDSHGRQRNPSSSLNQNASSASCTHFKPACSWLTGPISSYSDKIMAPIVETLQQ